MRVAKRFRWEAAHRLPWHDGPCRHLHGHSYAMEVTVEGPVDAQGMVIDFQEVKRAIKPLVEAWDHSTFVAQNDAELLGVLQQTGWRHYVLPYDSTSENLAQYAADHLCRDAADAFARLGVTSVRVRVQETETCYAEVDVAVAQTAAGDGVDLDTHVLMAPVPQPGVSDRPALHVL